MRLIIDIDDGIAKGIRGEYDCNVEPSEIVRDFRATISDAIANGIPYEERPHDKWIPVSERLPEEANKSYIVTVKYGDDIVCSCQRFFFGEGIGWNDDCVVAWQPLPEPYKDVCNLCGADMRGEQEDDPN